MTPEVLDFIPGLLEDTDKYIEVADRHHVTAKQKGKLRIKMCDDNRYPFITTLNNLILAPDLRDRLFLKKYVNEFMTHLSFFKGVLHGVLRRKGE